MLLIPDESLKCCHIVCGSSIEAIVVGIESFLHNPQIRSLEHSRPELQARASKNKHRLHIVKRVETPIIRVLQWCPISSHSHQPALQKMVGEWRPLSPLTAIIVSASASVLLSLVCTSTVSICTVEQCRHQSLSTPTRKRPA